MSTFKKNDKVKIISGGKPFQGLYGTVISSDDYGVKVRVNFSENEEENRKVVNIFDENDLQLSENEDLNKGDSNMDNQVKLTEEELKHWCSDNDANFYTQDIIDNKVEIRGINEVLGVYDFETSILTLNESLYDTDTIPELDGEHNEDIIPDLDTQEDDFIHDYVFDVNIRDEKEVVPSWEFVGKIATAECVDDSVVFAKAEEKGYKLFCIEAPGFSKMVVAAKGITKEDIYGDYADYLEGNARVIEVK